ncbi:STM4011 family radical SAM protein [Oceanobacter mangrovi]|uniref:STM4011 family radical SAM protein n=1 Tax=Oceanobacter mangrovi TaxID=2862510 RepID=UPI001C8DF4AF|nr:STM4011 family radical SAM protein [Oceanobacter mangrovi]
MSMADTSAVATNHRADLRPLRILYRGKLSSCNYDCHYCPFGKQRDSRETLARDEAELLRFVDWVGQQSRAIEVMFTPWGEALIHPYYQNAIRQLCQLPQLHKVVIQTNLSSPAHQLRALAHDKLALWCTYHPQEVDEARFIQRCEALISAGIRFSVGGVANPEDIEALQSLRQQLPAQIYLWINLNRDNQQQLSEQDWQHLRAIDPLVDHNAHVYPSLGRPCLTGSEVISVDGDGEVQRCHFVKQSLGNLYQSNGYQATEVPCPNEGCDCHIGYLHMPELGLYRVFEGGELERIPVGY